MLQANCQAESQNFSAKPQKTESSAPLPEPLKAFLIGEKFIYDVFWMGVPVGEASLELKEKVELRDREAFHIVAVAKTNDFLSKIYPIYDELHSWMDTQKLYSLEFSKKVQEGRYRAEERMVFDHQLRKGNYESLKNGSKKEIDIPIGVQDILSAFYWFRMQSIEVGKSVKTQVATDEKTWDLEIQVLRRETKEFRNRPVIDTIVLEPKTKLKGILYRRGRAWVYVSADSRRAPVWITIQTPFGPVFGVLRG